jgi:four helix bundle protein
MSTQSNIALPFERANVTNYRDLVVWTRAMDIVEVCYKLSMQIPQSEIDGLTSQIRRAAVSIPSNIAEGHGRMNLGEYLKHLSIANGSLKELETHLIVAGRLHYINEEEIILVLEACSEVDRMLASLIQKLRQEHF